LYSGGMQTFLRTIEFLSLSLWLGADAFLSFVVAPGAFAILGSRDAAGMMVGFSLSRLHFAGVFLGVLFVVARLLRTQDLASLTAPAALCAVLMVLLTVASQFTVSRRMESLKKEMVSVQNTPETDPRRVEFNKLHHRSVAYEGAVLLFGLVAMYLLVREVAPQP
jgi:ABC-type transport system involved in multi-copper enzyme maturation permease subunit